MQDRESGEQVRGRSRRRGSRKAAEADSFKQAKGEQPEGDAASGKRTAVIAGCVALGILAAAGAAYTYMGLQYQRVFFPKTTINGMDASGKSVEEVKQMIAAGIEGYTLTLETRGGGEEVIRGNEIALHPEYDGTLEQILDAQKPLRWGFEARVDKPYAIGTLMVYDRQKLEEAVGALACLDPANVTNPVNAAMSEYREGVGYEIIPEEPGNLIRAERLLEEAANAIQNISDRLVLEELDVYVNPEITADNPELAAQVESWNRFVKTKVTYRFGSKSEVLDGSTIHQWLYDDGHAGAALDEGKVTEYVKQLGKNYNTAYQPKELKTSYGSTVKIVGGNYGWRINQSAEVQELAGILRSGQSQEREPVYSQKAASHDGPDYGNTYVEINLTAQHLYFYKDGRRIVEADFVSGNESRGWSTPAGAYPLTYKQRDATLKGENYATPVSYWMPFNGNIGMHDANWRSSFGGTLYKTGGSHGCVNLPPSAAKTIFENISAGVPVLCYHLPGTERATKPAATKPAETKPAETKPAETKPAETKPAETKPAETKPAETKPAETKPAPQPPAAPGQPGNGNATGGAVSQPSGTPGQPGSGNATGGAVSQPSGTPGQPGSGNATGGAVSAPGAAPAPGGPGSGNAPGAPGGSPSGTVSGPGQ